MLSHLFIVKVIKDLDNMSDEHKKYGSISYEKILDHMIILSEEIKKTIDNTFQILYKEQIEIAYSEKGEFCTYKNDLSSKVLFDLFKYYLSSRKEPKSILEELTLYSLDLDVMKGYCYGEMQIEKINPE